MRDAKCLKFRKGLSAVVAVGAMSALCGANGSAHAFTANEVLNKMKPEERQAYLAGIVDGLAQARWIKDKPKNGAA